MINFNHYKEQYQKYVINAIWTVFICKKYDVHYDPKIPQFDILLNKGNDKSISGSCLPNFGLSPWAGKTMISGSIEFNDDTGKIKLFICNQEKEMTITAKLKNSNSIVGNAYQYKEENFTMLKRKGKKLTINDKKQLESHQDIIHNHVENITGTTPTGSPVQTPTGPPIETPKGLPIETPKGPPIETPKGPPIQTPKEQSTKGKLPKSFINS